MIDFLGWWLTGWLTFVMQAFDGWEEADGLRGVVVMGCRCLELAGELVRRVGRR